MGKMVFNVNPCAKEIIEVLEKHGATIYDMDEVFKAVKEEITLTTPIKEKYTTFNSGISCTRECSCEKSAISSRSNAKTSETY